MVYDSDLNITWLKNANANGLMSWAAANIWATNLVYGGYSDWRLPTTLQPDASCSNSFDAGPPYGMQSNGYNCTGSELGGVADQSITATHNANYNLFNNIQSSVYWSGTEYAPDTNRAWYFNTNLGDQYGGFKYNALYGWAVRSGDVAAAVPEPGSLILLGAGLAGWIGGLRRCG